MRIKTPVSIGLIGAGRIGTSHASILKHRFSEVTLRAIVDPMLNAARRLADSLDIETVYDSAEKVFDDPAIEAVVITLPARFHAGMVLQALDAGKSVFVEKPMAGNLSDADRIIEAVEQKKKFSASRFQSTLGPCFLRCKNGD